jgi:hypothetical protein
MEVEKSVKWSDDTDEKERNETVARHVHSTGFDLRCSPRQDRATPRALD